METLIVVGVVLAVLVKRGVERWLR